VNGVQSEAVEKLADGDAAQMRFEEHRHHVMGGHGQPIRGLAPDGAKQALAGSHEMSDPSLIVSPVRYENNRSARKTNQRDMNAQDRASRDVTIP
jgi:hypothetical protein